MLWSMIAMDSEQEKYEYFASLVDYCPVTGEFKRKDGRKVRIDHNGYVIFSKTINRKQHILMGHKLAYYINTGKVPASIVDHIDNNKSNNTATNLRQATHRQNSMNTKKRNHHGNGVKCTSRFKGVRFYGPSKKTGKLPKKPYQARILTSRNEEISLGTFACEIEAAKAYNDKAVELFGEFANLNVIN